MEVGKEREREGMEEGEGRKEFGREVCRFLGCLDLAQFCKVFAIPSSLHISLFHSFFFFRNFM